MTVAPTTAPDGSLYTTMTVFARNGRSYSANMLCCMNLPPLPLDLKPLRSADGSAMHEVSLCTTMEQIGSPSHLIKQEKYSVSACG